ncbi:MAG: discoidin domain-containing protein [Pirellulales bacterium]|nr:discoidin domain-containing protein [Pirellulales bacterium]
MLQTGDGAALHRSGKATQSSTGYGGVPERAIDGNLNQVYTGNSVTHTNQETNPWWMVDLGGVKDIGRINIYNRGENLESRLEGAIVEILDADGKKVVYTTKIPGVSKQSLEAK